MDALTRKQCMGWDWEEGKSLAERILNSRQMTSKSKDWFPRSLVQFVSLLLFSFLSVFVCFFFTIGSSSSSSSFLRFCQLCSELIPI